MDGSDTKRGDTIFNMVDHSQLNNDQKRAVEYRGGPLLVLAGAGSGKTKVLTHRAASFIASGEVGAHEVVLLTFTNKAANEMKERVIALIGTAPNFAGTFHSFSARVLRMWGSAIGVERNFAIYDETDKKDVVKDILTDMGLSPTSYNPGSIASTISWAKSEGISPLAYAESAKGDWGEKVFKIYLQYDKVLRDSNALDFDDLLTKTVELLNKHEDVRGRVQATCKVLLVDEWQDTNKIQYQLTRHLGGHDNVTVVGDAAQSIYSWRGADYRNVELFLKDFKGAKVVNLEQNYRSTQTILSAANCVISKNRSHPVLSLWTNNAQGDRVRLFAAQSGNTEAAFIAGEIVSLVTQGFDYKDVCILYRTNAQSRVIEEALLAQSIPYTLIGGTKFYERAEVKDIIAYLKLVDNPKDGVSKKRVEKIGKRRFDSFLEIRDELKQTSDEGRIDSIEILDRIFSVTNYLGRFNEDNPDDFARLENIKELRSVASQFPRLTDFLENIALVQSEYDSEVGKGDTKNAVNLMTMHAAKGLEFPVVFLVGMEEGLFPHSRSLTDLKQLEEERRLAYVGITRAKEILYLTYAMRRLYFGTTSSNPPSRFLMDIPQNLLQAVGYEERIREYSF